MTTITLDVTQGTPVQLLLGSVVVKRVVATSAVAALSVLLADVTATAQTGPTANVVLQNEISNFVRTKTAVKDCANVPRDYTNTGIGLGTATTITAGTVTPPNSLSIRGNQAERAVNFVTSLGLRATASGGTVGDKITITVDYEGNLPPVV